jgi:hypothetical protein
MDTGKVRALHNDTKRLVDGGEWTGSYIVAVENTHILIIVRSPRPWSEHHKWRGRVNRMWPQSLKGHHHMLPHVLHAPHTMYWLKLPVPQKTCAR